MKKIISLILIAAIALMICSCGVAKMPTASEIKGTVSGDVYENEYLSLKFTKPSEWVFSTEEELEQLSGATADLLEENGYEGDESIQYYDMMSGDIETGNNINIILQIVGSTGKIDYDEVLDANQAEVKNMGDAIGINYTFSEHETVKLSGNEFHKFIATADVEGFTFTQACYITVVRGVCVNITITIMDDLDVRAVEAMFS